MATTRRKTDVDRVDQMLGFSIIILVIMAVICILIYSTGNLSDMVFDLLYPQKF